MLIDLHALTRATEPGGHDPLKIIERAREAGLDGVAFVERLHSSHAKDLIRAGEEADYMRVGRTLKMLVKETG